MQSVRSGKVNHCLWLWRSFLVFFCHSLSLSLSSAFLFDCTNTSFNLISRSKCYFITAMHFFLPKNKRIFFLCRLSNLFLLVCSLILFFFVFNFLLNDLSKPKNQKKNHNNRAKHDGKLNKQIMCTNSSGWSACADGMGKRVRIVLVY